jgi:nucleotide-binding universal stress UspA family protein
MEPTRQAERIVPEQRGLEPRPYRRILVPLDGSAFAEAAVRPAAELASRASATICLVTAIQQGAGEAVTMEPIPHDGLDVVRRAGALEAHLEEAQERIRKEWGCDVSIEILSGTSPSRMLVEFAELLGVDLVVTATHSRGLVERTLLGSTSADLARAVSCPTLLVPVETSDDHPDHAPLQGDVRGVIAAIDPSLNDADPAFAHAFTWGRLYGAHVTLVQVAVTVPMPSTGPDGAWPLSMGPGLEFSRENREAMEHQVGALADALRAQGVEAEAQVLEGPAVAGAIADLAERRNADLVVVGRHHKSWLQRLWTGSESARLHDKVRTSGLLVCPIVD